MLPPIFIVYTLVVSGGISKGPTITFYAQDVQADFYWVNKKQVSVKFVLPKYRPNNCGQTLFNQPNGDKFISSFYDQIKITCGKRRCKSHWIMIARHRILSRMWSNHVTKIHVMDVLDENKASGEMGLPWVETWVKARYMKMTRVIAVSI